MSEASKEHLSAVRRLALHCGVQPFHRDAFGARRVVPLSTLVPVLGVLGWKASTLAQAVESERRFIETEHARVLQPVTVLWEGKASRVEVRPRLSGRARKFTLTCALALESGESRVWSQSFTAADLRA
ncbi:MAG TPA: hypothetical protein DEB06_07490, partial [Phycisphaerales bacterium]|nr:hypothetical protein [Phycisphaerales bacterium]